MSAAFSVPSDLDDEIAEPPPGLAADELAHHHADEGEGDGRA